MNRKNYRVYLLFLVLLFLLGMIACVGKKNEAEAGRAISDISDTLESGAASLEEQEEDSKETVVTEDKSESDEIAGNNAGNNIEETPEDILPEDKVESQAEIEAGEEGDTREEQSGSDQREKSVRRVDIYTIDDATLETVSLTAMLDVTDGLKIDAVVEAVCLAMEDHQIEVKIGSTVVEKGKVTVDILAKEEWQPFGNAGASVEGVILDCISYSLFDNFEEIQEIYFTVNGKAYESGHIYLPMGEAYLKKE